MKTSLEFSKKLKEAGFVKYADYVWRNNAHLGYELTDKYICDYNKDDYHSYDILNDLCVTYAESIFGEIVSHVKTINVEYFQSYSILGARYFTNEVLKMMQENKTQEHVENYIWKKCILNKDNK